MGLDNRAVIVTGGAGLIGSHLCKELLNKGEKVICIDNFHTGDKRNIEEFATNPNFKLLYCDICDPNIIFYIKESINYRGVKEIYNFACPASPIHYQRDPIQTINTCVSGTLHMLNVANYFKASFLQASTSEVYGSPLIHPQIEIYWGNVNPIGPRACYDEGKRCAEALCINYYNKNNIPIKIIRIFNTYGPNMVMNDGRVISNFIVNALRGKDLIIYGNGMKTRSFCYVDDLVEGIFLAMKTPYNFTGPLNLGNDHEITIYELAEKITILCNSPSKIILGKETKDDPDTRCPDIHLAKKKLEWYPKTSLDRGLNKTIKYFQNLIIQQEIMKGKKYEGEKN